MKRPWIKFYCADWRGDARLHACSLAARGLWIEMMAVMHEAEPYGHLLLNGNPLSIPQLGKLVGANPKTVSAGLSELILNGVCSRNDGGVIFSRRMVRDFEKAKANQINGATGGNPTLLKTVNHQVNPPDKAHIPDTRTHRPERSLSHLEHKQVQNFSGIGKLKSKGWSPPRHGATGKGRTYINFGTPEWLAYAEDWRAVHGCDPEPNPHGGKWFKTLGEQAA